MKTIEALLIGTALIVVAWIALGVFLDRDDDAFMNHMHDARCAAYADLGRLAFELNDEMTDTGHGKILREADLASIKAAHGSARDRIFEKYPQLTKPELVDLMFAAHQRQAEYRDTAAVFMTTITPFAFRERLYTECQEYGL